MKRKFLVHTAALVSGVVEIIIDEEVVNKIHRGEIRASEGLNASMVTIQGDGPRCDNSAMVLAVEEEGQIHEGQQNLLCWAASTTLMAEVLRRTVSRELLEPTQVFVPSGMKH